MYEASSNSNINPADMWPDEERPEEDAFALAMRRLHGADDQDEE